MEENIIKSKDRVQKHGEVFTPSWMVQKMLDTPGIREKTEDTTTIIVAQRISTILNADQIIVLDEGNMAGIGTHKELMKNCEVYRQIAMSQLSEEELA